ncbi:hypothetical protein [Geoalkalibacter subterraneus]|nr:hypothetical protein [Geoalkalibacter subterraneus]
MLHKKVSKGRVVFWSIETTSNALSIKAGFVGGPIRHSEIPFEKCTEGITTELSRNINRMLKAGFVQNAEEFKKLSGPASEAYHRYQKEVENQRMVQASKISSPFVWF